MTWNQKLRLAITAAGFRPSELALHINVHPVTVSGWLSGRHKPRSANRKKVAATLEIDSGWLWEDCRG